MPATFKDRKAKILEDLSIPDEQYQDLSPKGSVDEGIRELISEINDLPDYVTTSSCAGRIAVYLEGAKGAKGGGKWLFTSHDPIELPRETDSESLLSVFGLTDEPASAPSEVEGVRFVHFKSEPMILHILTSSLEAAHHASGAALQAGFRESGSNGLLRNKDGSATTPLVAVRSSGLAFDCLIGYQLPGVEDVAVKPMVSESYLRTLVGMANQRFKTNIERRERFRTALLKDTMARKPKP
ncbi:hypothetical protein B0A50_08364 [Salinomyces thailandicus]|uniref:tRNA(Phe) 7-[(3-amino-3-carboxypropyl)-4-demethylwyosine(37)-N(4)]-methyltransferase n=1 Tax=Salinomyces thailandicus TaxID=706561 RepID=A0A4U0TJU2_9PEZI|nr:hypothetical protein B0A50_08364 [Salinomyces thailandica]